MINANGISLLRRFVALFLALALCAGPLASLAVQPQNPVDFILSWQADDGTALTSTAVPVPYAEFPNSYWLYADQQAVQKDAVLSAIDNFSQYPGGFSIVNGQPLSLLIRPDAGLTPAAENAVQVDAYDAQGNILMSYWLFVSLQTPQPQPPVVVEPPVAVVDTTVTVNYLNVADGQPVASPTAQYFNAAGAYTIYPQASDLQEGYLPAAGYPTEQGIEVNESTGNISVDFYYEKPAPVAQPADITVRYVDRDNGQDIAPSQYKTLQPGETMVYPELIVIPEGYQPLDVEPRMVTVDINGANPQVVEFIYSKAAPVIDVAVTVNYLNVEDGQPVASPTAQYFNAAGAYTIYPQANDLQEGYLPAAGYPTKVSIEVNENTGNISVDFYYEKPAPVVQPADITVRYIDRDNGQDIAPTQTKTLQPGETMIYPELTMIPEGYEALDLEPRLVTVDINGANPQVVEFIYSKVVPAPVNDAAITIYFEDENGDPVADPIQRIYSAGEHLVHGEIIEGWELTDPTPVVLKVDASGAMPGEIRFTYRPLIAASVDITVNYLDAAGNPLLPAGTQTVHDGMNTIEAQPIEGYRVAGESTQYVRVTMDGADQQSITFVYESTAGEPAEATPPAAPAVNLEPNVIPQSALVLTQFQDEGSNQASSLQTLQPVILTSEAEGFGGPVKVTVTLAGDRIIKVEAEGESETDGIGTLALIDIPARMVEKRSVDVDVLAGATYTSEAIIKAAKGALNLTTTLSKTFDYDFKTFRWGSNRQEVHAVEGIPDYEGKIDSVNATYIAYNTKAVGMDVLLTYYFSDEGLYSTRYTLKEEHNNEALYIDNYSAFKDALTKKYGEPLIDSEEWQDDLKKDYYSNRKGDALSYGYLTYSTLYITDRTFIRMSISADNFDISMTVDYKSFALSPGEIDYSSDL